MVSGADMWTFGAALPESYAPNVQSLSDLATLGQPGDHFLIALPTCSKISKRSINLSPSVYLPLYPITMEVCLLWTSCCRHYTFTGTHLQQHPNSFCAPAHRLQLTYSLKMCLSQPSQCRPALLWTLAHHLWLTDTTVISWSLGDYWQALACKIQQIPLPSSWLQPYLLQQVLNLSPQEGTLPSLSFFVYHLLVPSYPLELFYILWSSIIA